MKVKWSDILSVGVGEIDEQHKNLFGIMNKLLDAITGESRKETIPEIFDALESYVDGHFDLEEMHMVRYGYPEYPSHKSEHEKFAGDVEAFRMRFNTEKERSCDSLIETELSLSKWLINHICKVDKEFGIFLRKGKLEILTGDGNQ